MKIMRKNVAGSASLNALSLDPVDSKIRGEGPLLTAADNCPTLAIMSYIIRPSIWIKKKHIVSDGLENQSRNQSSHRNAISPGHVTKHVDRVQPKCFIASEAPPLFSRAFSPAHVSGGDCITFFS